MILNITIKIDKVINFEIEEDRKLWEDASKEDQLLYIKTKFNEYLDDTAILSDMSNDEFKKSIIEIK